MVGHSILACLLVFTGLNAGRDGVQPRNLNHLLNSSVDGLR